MKPVTILMLQLLMMTITAKADIESLSDQCVNVYPHGIGEVPYDVLAGAERTTTARFAEIGVVVHWPKRSHKKAKMN
jgi:hypothetical protein